MEEIDALLQDWVGQGLIPGGVCCIRIERENRYLGAFGAYNDHNSTRFVHTETLFDLASLTKVVATLPIILMLIQERQIGLNDPVSRYIGTFMHNNVNIKHLLQHTSGLPADLPFMPRHTEGREVLKEICRCSLQSEPGLTVSYSDAGMILLGEVAARVAGAPLDEIAKQWIYEPLGMANTGYARTLANPAARAAATECVDGRYIVGEVHDEKTWHMGGVTGSAGLFGCAGDLARYTDAWLYPEDTGLLQPAIVEACLKFPLEGRGLGWEVYHDRRLLPLSCGATWPLGSFGHTGFTGTSIWCDPQDHICVVWLTNAVHAGRDMPVRRLRRILHDRIREALGAAGHTPFPE